MDIKSLEERHQCLKIQTLPLREHNIGLLQHQKLNAVKCNNFYFFTTVVCSINRVCRKEHSPLILN
jgi:hypothetical protein